MYGHSDAVTGLALARRSSDRLARADFAAFVAGGLLLSAEDLLGGPDVVPALGGTALLAGTLLFTWNVLSVVREHSPRSLGAISGRPANSDGIPDEHTGDAGSR